MIPVTFRPLPSWPHPSTVARRAWYQFRAPWSKTLELLEREVRMLHGSNIVLGAGFQEEDLRLDGMPKAGAREPEHPGIELSFDSKHGRLVYATDAYNRWQANVRAIALSLQALRAVDRYGASTQGQQYAGWRQLTAGDGGPTTQDEAIELLERVLEQPIHLPGDMKAIVRKAMLRTHPDHGGDPDMFRKVKAARDLLVGG